MNPSESEMNELASELLKHGQTLWASIECDAKPQCVIIYAKLSTPMQSGLCGALADSERLLTAVLDHRLDGRSWLAAIQWSEDRLCRTIGPRLAGRHDEVPACC